MKRLVVALFLVAAVAAGVWFFLNRRESKAGAAASTDIHVVDTGEVSVALKETGVVKPRQTVAVKSKVSGKIREVLVAEGEKVRSGQLVAVVEPDAQAQLTLSQRRLELRRRKIEASTRRSGSGCGSGSSPRPGSPRRGMPRRRSGTSGRRRTSSTRSGPP